jgi:hypothetical protein
VEEFIPYLLVVIGWHPDHPGEYTFHRAPTAYATLSACGADGSEYVAQRDIYRTEFGGMRFAYKCIRSASGDESDAAWQALQEKNAERK